MDKGCIIMRSLTHPEQELRLGLALINPFQKMYMLSFNKYYALFILLIALLSCHTISYNKNKPINVNYEKAYILISDQKSHFQKEISVNKEIINFYHYTHFFKQELVAKQVTLNIEAISQPIVVEIIPRLNKIGVINKGQVAVFFSEIKEGYFFAEIFMHSLYSYENRPHFGVSEVFLFEIVNNQEVIIISNKLFEYN